MNARLLTATIGLVLSLITQTLSAGAVPKLINYQGSLSDASGNPLAIGEYTLSFTIFDSPTATAAVWGPQVFDGAAGAGHGALVPVVKGYFNVILGPVDTASRSLDSAFGPNQAERYLEITVNGGAPILPRQQILSAPYAMSAAYTPGEVPVGGIVPYAGSVASLSANWKVADGSLVSDAESPLNNTYLPNLNGKFLRGGTPGFSGGSDLHNHYLSMYSSNVWIPSKSINGYTNSRSTASRANAFSPNIYSLGIDLNEADPKTSHGHVNGLVSWSGNTNSSSSLPSYYSVYYIVRIK